MRNFHCCDRFRNLRAKVEGESRNDVRINIVVDVIVILVGAHDVSDVKESRRLIESRATRPKLADRRRQFASFTCHEVDVVRQREIMTNGEGDVTGDVLLMLGDVLVARLDHFDAGRGAFP